MDAHAVVVQAVATVIVLGVDGPSGVCQTGYTQYFSIISWLPLRDFVVNKYIE